MKNFGWYLFWSVGYLMTLRVAGLWVIWVIVPITGDLEGRTDIFERLMVAFGWLSSYMLIGIAGGYHQKKN